ncbi:hypothetical protein L873DRAFT_922685 [Choiromyces venosus 120613-1]|uniref:Uncharacterized protein n=1 Tax=Choiromyces venosus 120613-1 TaxID=1336337 RepID=A0A3N4JM97_9PEZI|nr:hypothetical protein L873DRAFT_922685 [Choiromyces venosus 120613-1]
MAFTMDNTYCSTALFADQVKRLVARGLLFLTHTLEQKKKVSKSQPEHPEEAGFILYIFLVPFSTSNTVFLKMAGTVDDACPLVMCSLLMAHYSTVKLGLLLLFLEAYLRHHQLQYGNRGRSPLQIHEPSGVPATRVLDLSCSNSLWRGRWNVVVFCCLLLLLRQNQKKQRTPSYKKT